MGSFGWRYLRRLPFGHPPFLPFSRAAAVLAADVACPPFRPNATAAGFLRATLVPFVDVALREGLDALQRQVGKFGREALKGGDVASLQGGVSAGHQVAACGVHVGILPNRLGIVKWVK